MSMSHAHLGEEIIELKKLLFHACQLLEQVDFLPEDSELEHWFQDEQNSRELDEEAKSDR